MTLLFAGAVAITTVILSLAAYLLVAAGSAADAREGALAQSRFNVALAQTILPAEGAGPTDYERLLRALAIRGDFATLFEEGDQTYRSGPQVTSDLVSADLRASVNADRLTYQRGIMGGEPTLVVGSLVRSGGPAAYFIYPQGERTADLARLRTILIAVSLLLAAAGSLLGWVIAQRLLRPVDQAAAAAGRMAAGDLGARLPVTPDEFGALAASFNTMAESLAGKISALEAAQARERRFTADVAHELRTPVAALVGEASLLRAHLDGTDRDGPTGSRTERSSAGGDNVAGAGSMTPEARRAAELVVLDIARLRRLVDDLLEISRIDARSADIAREEVEVEDFLRRAAAARGWPPVVTLPQRRGEGIVITTDRRRLERIVVNLVENALRHGAPPIAVEARVAHPPGGGAHKPAQLVLTVTDHGPGIPPDHLVHVFERFYKADPSRPAGTGTGLGLAIAWENARLLGGSLRVRSAPGEGTRFVLRLPLGPSDSIEHDQA